MVLFMKPLVEILNMLGSDNTLLPERWRGDCKKILSALKDVLPVFEAKDKPQINYPFNLLELYVELYLLVHHQKDTKLKFELYDRLFLICEVALRRNEP